MSVMGVLLQLLLVVGIPLAGSMSCSYGPRGSLTVTCVNAIPFYFKRTSYTFDNLDQTLVCEDCNLAYIPNYTFDIPFNEIATLNLSNSKVRIMEAQAFVGLIFMKKLFLQNNSIELISPGTFLGVKLLEVLNLANNSIKHIVNNGFRELENLKELNLAYNKILGIDVQGFAGLSMLETLNLEHNLIASTCFIYGGLNKLKIINLNSNYIHVISRNCFQGLGRLRELYLSENQLKFLSPEGFYGLNNLRLLNLSSNGLLLVDQFAFSSLHFLEILLLDHNGLQGIQQRLFRGLHFLRDLDLSVNNISEFKTSYFIGAPELRFLNLSNNRIEQLEKTGILSLPKLHILDFDSNSIKEVGYNSIFVHIPRIETLYLRRNPLLCYEVTELEKFFDSHDVQLFVDKLDRPCNATTPKGKIPEILEDFPSETSSNPLIALFVCIGLIFVGLFVLFFLQYRSYWDIKQIVEGEHVQSCWLPSHLRRPLFCSQLNCFK